MKTRLLPLPLACLPPGLAQALDFCRISALAVNFGQHDAGSPVPLDSVGTIRVVCLNLFNPGGGRVAQIGRSLPGAGARSTRHLADNGGNLPGLWRMQ